MVKQVWTFTEHTNVKEIHESGVYDRTRMMNHVAMDKGVEERFQTLTGATGTVTHDCVHGNVFFHTAPAANFTANFTNLDLSEEHAKNVVITIDQDATSYMPTAVQIGGDAQTINWQGNSAPSGTDSGVDIITFSILNDAGSYIVLGMAISYGGS